jgi:hypothetical protein
MERHLPNPFQRGDAEFAEITRRKQLKFAERFSALLRVLRVSALKKNPLARRKALSG